MPHLSEEFDLGPSTVISKLLFHRRQIDGTCWTIFWRHCDETFGVTDGEFKIYEKHIPVSERRQLAGNVATSLLNERWRKIFENRGFTFADRDMNDEEVEVEISNGSDIATVTLKRTNVPGRIAAVFNAMVDDYLVVSKENVEHRSKQMTEKYKVIAQKRRYSRPDVQTPAKTRRIRELPKGLHFPDENGEINSP